MATTTTTTSSKRILILGRPKSGKLSLVKALTSSLPSGLVHESTPHAGLTHSISLTTRYYSTEAGIWIDEIPEEREVWLEEYLSEEAKEVFLNLAAIILTVDAGTSGSDEDLDVLRKLGERGDVVEWEGTSIVVGKKSEKPRIVDIASICEESTLEFIDLNESGENDYGGISLNDE